jgi:hypothetical protein
MISNALLLAIVLFMAFCFFLMDRLKFLVPYRQAIFHDESTSVREGIVPITARAGLLDGQCAYNPSASLKP